MDAAPIHHHFSAALNQIWRHVNAMLHENTAVIRIDWRGQSRLKFTGDSRGVTYNRIGYHTLSWVSLQ